MNPKFTFTAASALIEKVIFYLIGGMGGFIVGLMYLSLDIHSLGHDRRSHILFINVLIGIVVAIALYEYKKAKNLRDNNKMRDEMVTLITHEMRTGLTSTGWAIQLILQDYSDALTETDKKMLESAVGSIKTTVMHSVNLLDISLLDVRKTNISLEKTSLLLLEEVFNDTIKKYAFGAERKGVRLMADIHLDHALQVEVDVLRLRIILENLLENAFQYTTGNKKDITVHINNNETAMNIIVKDTGIGIPAREQDKIFSEFYRATNARRKLSSGSGIGLYMCRQYVKAHQGVIRFESRENEGTAFYITIPLKTTANVNEFLKKI